MILAALSHSFRLSLRATLWAWAAQSRRRPVAKHSAELSRATARRDTQAQHAAFVAAKRARTEALRREVGGKRTRRITILNIIGA